MSNSKIQVGRPGGLDIGPYLDWVKSHFHHITSAGKHADFLAAAFGTVCTTNFKAPAEKTIAGWSRSGRASPEKVADLLQCAEGHPDDPPWKLLVPILRNILASAGSKKAPASKDEDQSPAQPTSSNESSPLPGPYSDRVHARYDNCRPDIMVSGGAEHRAQQAESSRREYERKRDERLARERIVDRARDKSRDSRELFNSLRRPESWQG